MTPEPNRPDEREAQDQRDADTLEREVLPYMTRPWTQDALRRAVQLLRRDAPREGASVDENDIAAAILATEDGDVSTLDDWLRDCSFDIGDRLNFGLRAARRVLALLPAGEERRLTKPATVGNTTFGTGVKESLVIDRAQREHDYRRERQAAALADRAPREGGEAMSEQSKAEEAAINDDSPQGRADNAAVDWFARMMKAKLAKKRAEGYGGWDDPSVCSVEFLQEGLARHMAKGDPVDVANFCMMLRHYCAPTRPQPASAREVVNARRAEVMAHWHERAVALGYDGVEDVLRLALPCIVNSAGEDRPQPAGDPLVAEAGRRYAALGSRPVVDEAMVGKPQVSTTYGMRGGETIPQVLVIYEFPPEDWKARDAFAAALRAPEPQS